MTAAMRFAVLGCGGIGRLHAQTVRSLGERAELAVVIDAVSEAADALAAECGVEGSSSLADVLARDDIDTVTICTPSGQHADQAVAVLDAGKHVIIEKPIDVTVQAAKRVREAELRSGRTATVISQRRSREVNQLVERAARTGQFGRLTSATASLALWRSQEYYDSGAWRGTWELDGGGALMNQGIHTLDLLVWFLGEPVEVYARAGCLAHERIEVEDTAVATVVFANGALGVVHGTTAAFPGLTQRVTIHGDRGSAVVENEQLVYFHSADLAGNTAGDTAGDTAGKGNQAELLVPTPEPYKPASASKPIGATETSHTAQFADFVDAVEQGRRPLVTVEDATRTLALICGIYESARLGKAVPVRS